MPLLTVCLVRLSNSKSERMARGNHDQMPKGFVDGLSDHVPDNFSNSMLKLLKRKE
jgi:hypothetical protein